MDVSIIIANWNTKEYLQDCLSSVIRNTQGILYEIIVVDDNSTDDSIKMLKNFPLVKVLVNEKNLGFAKTNNRGVKIATGKYVFLLNTDTLLVDNAIYSFYRFMEEHPDAYSCGGLLLNEDLTKQVSYVHFPSLRQMVLDSLFINDIFPKLGLPSKGKPPAKLKIKTVDYIVGAAIMIRKSIIDKYGLFDDNFSSYSEEAEFCYRMNKLGFKAYFIPFVKIIHFGGKSFVNKKEYRAMLICRGTQKFLKKYHSKFYVWVYRLMFAWHYVIRYIFGKNQEWSRYMIKYSLW